MAIEKITQEERKSLKLVPFGKKHPVRAALEQMQAGEMLRVGYEDFRWRRKTPGVIVSELEQRKRIKFKIWKEKLKGGWVIERVK